MYGNFCSITNPMMFASTHFDIWTGNGAGFEDRGSLFTSWFESLWWISLAPTIVVCCWKASFSLSIPQLYYIRIEYLHPPFGAGNLCLQIGRPQRLASLVFLGRSFVPRSALIRMFGLEYVNIFACLSISTLSCCCFAFGRGDSNWNYKYQGL